MRFSATALLLAATSSFSTMATPLPADMNDIEKRWAAGDSEQQIHAGLSHRDMTPAWPVARDAQPEAGFATATDFRSLEVAEKRGASLTSQMKNFVTSFMRTKGETINVREAEDAPVLKPRKAMQYYFTA